MSGAAFLLAAARQEHGRSAGLRTDALRPAAARYMSHLPRRGRQPGGNDGERSYSCLFMMPLAGAGFDTFTLAAEAGE